MEWCSFIPWIIGIGAAILGGLIGYYLMRPKVLMLESGLKSRNNEYDNLDGEYKISLEQKTSLEQDNEKLHAELGAEHNRVKGLNTALSEEVASRKISEGNVATHLAAIAALKASLEAKDVELKDSENKMAVSLAGANADLSASEANLNGEIAALKASLEA